MQLKITLIAALLAATVLPATAADIGRGNSLTVLHRIEVDTGDGKVQVGVKVENHSDQTIYFPKRNRGGKGTEQLPLRAA